MKTENKKKVSLSLVPLYQPDTPVLPDKKPSTNIGLYVPYGEDNKYPDFLNTLYQNSAILSSIINAEQDYILGNGISFNDFILSKLTFNSKKEFRTIFQRIVFDKILTGAYAIKLIYNRNLDVCKIEYIDIRNLRLSLDSQTIYFSESWNQGRRGELYKYTNYDTFVPGEDTNNPYQCIYYNKGRARGIYGIPSWQGAIPAVQTTCEIDRFNLHSIMHGLSASSIINIPNSDSYTEEERKEVEKKFRENFGGSDNADSFVLSFNPTSDDKVEISKIDDDNFADKYDLLTKSAFKSIFTAFRMAPQLAGYLQDNIGFNNQEFGESFNIFNKTVIQPIQQTLMNDFDDLFETENSLIIKPFTLDDVQNEPSI